MWTTDVHDVRGGPALVVVVAAGAATLAAGDGRSRPPRPAEPADDEREPSTHAPTTVSTTTSAAGIAMARAERHAAETLPKRVAGAGFLSVLDPQGRDQLADGQRPGAPPHPGPTGRREYGQAVVAALGGAGRAVTIEAGGIVDMSSEDEGPGGIPTTSGLHPRVSPASLTAPELRTVRTTIVDVPRPFAS